MAKKVHDYAFTIVRPKDPTGIFTQLRTHPLVRGVFFGEEIAPTSGFIHLQGYIWFNEPVSFSKAKRVIGNKAFVQRAVKSPEANYEYCRKQKRAFFKQMPMEKIQKLWLDKQKVLCYNPIKSSAETVGGLGG